MRASESRHARLPRQSEDLLLNRADLRQQHHKEQRLGEVPQDKQGKQGLPVESGRSFRRSGDSAGHRLRRRRRILGAEGVGHQGTAGHNWNSAALRRLLQLITLPNHHTPHPYLEISPRPNSQ